MNLNMALSLSQEALNSELAPHVYILVLEEQRPLGHLLRVGVCPGLRASDPVTAKTSNNSAQYHNLNPLTFG